MLTLPRSTFQSIRSAGHARELYPWLQSAIELEHATLPPYLTAFYSIAPGENTEVAGIIRSVVMEEMLHMMIACNVLNAIGGSPAIDQPRFVPRYPGHLPMGVRPDLEVSLEPLSRRLVKDVFMEIEEPEDPQSFPRTALRKSAPQAEEFGTIGEFYEAIIEKLAELGDAAFVGDPSRQVVGAGYPPDALFPITNVETATRALRLIVQQGEGSGRNPLDPEGAPAHYYRFAEIVQGRRLRRDPQSPGGFSYSGDLVPLDPNGVLPLAANKHLSDYTVGSPAWYRVSAANRAYSSLLAALHNATNGAPASLRDAIGLMFTLRLAFLACTEVDGPEAGTKAAPTFEFVPQEAR